MPFDELPRVYNPASGIIVNANARLVPDDYRHFITRDWAEPYRQRRANQLLREVERHPVYGMIAIQADNLSPDAADMLPLLLKPEPRNPRAAKVRDMMGRWNRFMLARRPEPLIYDAWIWRAAARPAGRRLGEELFRRHGRAQRVADPAHPARQARLVRRPHAPDGRDLRRHRSRPRSSGRSTGSPAAQGTDIESWQWGSEHSAAHRHPLFDARAAAARSRLGALPVRRRRAHP